MNDTTINYIQQINSFWDKFNSLEDGKPYHIATYFALLQINNRCGWKKVFNVNFEQIMNMSRVSKTSYYKSCQWLFENEFLNLYQKGENQFSPAKFSITELSHIWESTRKAEGTQKESKGNIHKLYKHNKLIYKKSEIFKFFIEEGFTKEEAQKFINYNEALNWKNISNWKPMAENWILKIKNTKKNGNKKNNSKNEKRNKLEKQNYEARF